MTTRPALYQRHFRLAEAPFSIAPDPRFLYMSEKHREALAHLVYGIKNGGFVLLTGEVGTGKTTICRCVLEQVPETCDVAFIFNPKLTAIELLAATCDEFEIRYPRTTRSVKRFIDLINSHLLDAHAKGRTSILIIDEAQNLSAEVLEQLRLLTNLETNERKLLQIIMIGQPELRDMLRRPELRQFAQRITARYHLTPLTPDEVARYVAHRLKVAGERAPRFSKAALSRLCRLSGGVPRLINVICDRALLGAYAEGEDRVTAATIAKAAKEVLGGTTRGAARRMRLAAGALAGIVLIAGGAGLAAVAYRSDAGRLDELSRRYLGRGLGEMPWARPVADRREAGSAIEVAVTAGEDRQASPDRPPAAGDLASAGLAEATGTEAADEPAGDARPAALPADGPSAAATDVVTVLPVAVAARDPEPAEPLLPRSGPPGHGGVPSWVRAYEVLFAEWRISYRPDDGPPCEQAERQGLRCFKGHGGVERLRRLDLPAVVRLVGGDGEAVHAALTGLTPTTATLVVDGEPRTVPLAALEAQWSGDFTIVWRTPPGYQRPIGLGDGGPLVEWLSVALDDGEDGQGPRVPKARFDEELRDRTKRFQEARGLTESGIAGPETLILLRSSGGTGLPRLADDPEDR